MILCSKVSTYSIYVTNDAYNKIFYYDNSDWQN